MQEFHDFASTFSGESFLNRVARLPERYLGIEGAGVLLPCSVVYNSSKRPESLMLIFHVADPTYE